MANHFFLSTFEDSINTLSGGSQEQADRIRSLLQKAFKEGFDQGWNEGYEEAQVLDPEDHGGEWPF